MKKIWMKMLSVAASAVIALSSGGCIITEEMIDKVDRLNTTSQAGIMSTSASGDYGDSFGAADAYSNRKYVGIFYCLWLGFDTPEVMNGEKNVNAVYYGDNARENFKNHVLGFQQSDSTQYRYWGEPMYGYYESDDEWVIRKHLQLFALAGIDYLALDTTNALTYPDAVTVLLDCIAEYRAAGLPVPQVLFLTNTSSVSTVMSLYNQFYQNEKYEDCWFRGNGSKPWITCKFDGGTEAQQNTIKDYFYVKQAQWPTEQPIENGFPWIDWAYPQTAFYDAQLGGNIYAVSIAQHTGVGQGGIQFSDSVYARLLLQDGLNTRNNKNQTPDEVYNLNHGRGYDFKNSQNAYDDEERILRNENFRQQWEAPLNDDDASMVMILGWNEWIAGNWPSPNMMTYYDDLKAAMCDLVNLEFSRDIEMMAEGEHSYSDNCYLLMCKYIRDFKFTGTGGAYADGQNRAITADRIVAEEWEGATEFLSFANSCEVRDTRDAFNAKVQNKTGRNDILSLKAAKDAENLYFLVTTADAITERQATDTSWMNIFIGTRQPGGWNGLNYVLNRASADGTASLHKIAGESFTEVSGAECTYVVSGNQMLVKVPKSALGITEDAFTLELKVTDHLQKDFSVTELYVNGDVAPLGRINYVYTAK